MSMQLITHCRTCRSERPVGSRIILRIQEIFSVDECCMEHKIMQEPLLSNNERLCQNMCDEGIHGNGLQGSGLFGEEVLGNGLQGNGLQGNGLFSESIHGNELYGGGVRDNGLYSVGVQGNWLQSNGLQDNGLFSNNTLFGDNGLFSDNGLQCNGLFGESVHGNGLYGEGFQGEGLHQQQEQPEKPEQPEEPEEPEDPQPYAESVGEYEVSSTIASSVSSDTLIPEYPEGENIWSEERIVEEIKKLNEMGGSIFGTGDGQFNEEWLLSDDRE